MTDTPTVETQGSIRERDDHAEPSVFLPENLLREARRQRGLPPGLVPEICVFDPDGDIVRHLLRHTRAERSPSWACYHTELWETDAGGVRIGIVGCAVGAPFAVLVAEELFASGCSFLASITSAGKVAPDVPDQCLVVIDRAIRGEGTSDAYLPPAPTVAADPALIEATVQRLNGGGLPVLQGMSWTTDAPFRETPTALARAREAGAVVVEMEAAALYAFAEARERDIVCIAHVTNTMAVGETDFEKGPSDGAEQALAVISAIAQGWSASR